ncbi:hypothetical protein [Acinetobacter cumulans]|uniref:hypothetical protein n=1 Tax=Acinetobacter cumulans TaxID=2136182 RepID=UPI001D10793D|nr:hypothetical protein [Acinetobacter cumulans]
MAKKLQELLDARSSESQNRILEDAKIILKDYLADDLHLKQLAEETKSEKARKIILDDLEDQAHKNYAS